MPQRSLLARHLYSSRAIEMLQRSRIGDVRGDAPFKDRGNLVALEMP